MVLLWCSSTYLYYISKFMSDTIHLRDYHYDFDLDIVVLWSCYGVLRLTYTTYLNLCPTVHFFGQLLMSQDTSPTWIVLLESIYQIIQVFFCIFPMFVDSITIRFPMFGATQKIKNQRRKKECSEYFFNTKT